MKRLAMHAGCHGAEEGGDEDTEQGAGQGRRIPAVACSGMLVSIVVHAIACPQDAGLLPAS